MNNKGYTIMEAVIAMFLVVVMVGAVFSALMSSRRAIVASSEKEEILYSINSLYGLLKDCRSNPDCQLSKFNSCNSSFSSGNATQDMKNCDELFTFNFKNLCKNDATGKFEYTVRDTDGPATCLLEPNGKCEVNPRPFPDFYSLEIDAQCTED